MDDLSERARAILRENDRGGYSVPTDGLYPFQWCWDSGFAAMGYACFDQARAWRELERLLDGQWPDGMVPHIVFHRDDPRYFPGPEIWGTARTPPTSGITQPPILAVCARRLLERAEDRAAAAAARRLFPKLLAYHRWYHAARDPEASGLVALYHPWETGMDNSPAWDGPLARVPVDPLPPYERRDTGHVDASQRPHRADYDRYLTLVHRFRARAYQPQALYAESPFRIADVGVNSILLRADRDLLALAQELGIDAGRAELAATLERWAKAVRFPVPSTDPASPLFEPRRYWRGPVWLIVNWMIADGLGTCGRADLADRLREDSLALVRRHGFFEYFDPLTGEGLGGANFTWTAAVPLFWLL